MCAVLRQKCQCILSLIVDEPTLSDFVGSRSWLIIDLFDVNNSWMEYAAARWGEFDDYISYTGLVKCLKVVNDCAECAVKDIQEDLGYCQNVVHREVVTVANYHRQLVNFKTTRKDLLMQLISLFRLS